MLTKIVIIFILIAIIFALGSSLYFLVRDGEKKARTVKALTWRIILTIALIIFICVAYHYDWIHPNQNFNFKVSS
jgi:hypothetical protein